jgi:hypothetical protein
VVEAIVAVALMAMVAGTATTLFTGAAHSYVRSTTRTAVQRSITTVADLVMNDGRHAAAYTIKQENGTTAVLLKSSLDSDLQPYTITYTWNPNDQDVRRTVSQGDPPTTISSDIVASGVTSFAGATNIDGKGLAITITSGVRESQTQITLRLTTRLAPSQPTQGCYYSSTFWKTFWTGWSRGMSRGSGKP